MSAVAVILQNFGGPETEADVEPFLFALFNDPDVIHLPFGPGFQRWFAGRVSRERAPAVAPEYATMGGSPLTATTMTQADALRAELSRRLPEAERPSVHVGMRYTAPFIDEAIQAALDAGAERLIALPLFPQYSLTTTGSVHNAVAQSLDRRGKRRLPVSYVPAFYRHAGYRRSVAERIEEALADAPERASVHILFSAHGLPARYVRKGDPYQRQVQDCVQLIVDDMGWRGRWSLSWQSRVGPLKWLDPSTEREIERLAGAQDTDQLLVVPISFVGDHIETLYEIGHTYRAIAMERGARWFGVSKGLDDHPAFIGCLADLVEQALVGELEGVCYRCLLPRERQHLGRANCLDCKAKRPLYDRVWRTNQDLERGL